MKTCLLCNKPVGHSFAAVIVGAVMLGFEVIGYQPLKAGHCACQGSRCNICYQVYQGLAGDCLCTIITEQDYIQAGVAAGYREAA